MNAESTQSDVLAPFNALPVELQTVIHSGLSAFLDHCSREEILKIFPELLWQIEQSNHGSSHNEMTARMAAGISSPEPVHQTVVRRRSESIERMYNALVQRRKTPAQ